MLEVIALSRDDALEAEAGAAKLTAAPTSAPVVGETLASTSD